MYSCRHVFIKKTIHALKIGIQRRNKLVSSTICTTSIYVVCRLAFSRVLANLSCTEILQLHADADIM